MKLKDIEYILERHYVNIRNCCHCDYTNYEDSDLLHHLLLNHKEHLDKKQLKTIKEFLKK